MVKFFHIVILFRDSGFASTASYQSKVQFLTLYQFDKQGILKNTWDIEKEYSSMFHDFVLPQRYVVFFDCPSVFDLEQLMKGGPVLSWRPELGTRIGIMPRIGGAVRWLYTDPFFVFHFANAYEQTDQIIVDYVRHDKLVMLMQEDKSVPPALYRTTINLLTGTVQHQPLDERLGEFPRIREDKNSVSHRFIYTLSKSATISNPRAMNILVKYDSANHTSQICDFGDDKEIGEAVFAPARTNTGEDNGYLMLFVYHNDSKISEFIILNAHHITDEPLARIQLPQRIPNGLHGSWMPGEWSILD